LDRIISIEVTALKFIDSEIIWEDISNEDYFGDIIGVSKPEKADLEKIELLFTPSLAPYIVTKPIHSSQIDKQVEDGLIVKIEVIPNYELEQLILSFGEGVKVLKPQSLVNRLNLRIESMLNNYVV
jgi:predicted DNA-binding transcriptional regulator YafY